MPAILSDVVTDVVAAAAKLRADDRLISAPEQMLNEIEALLDAVTVVESAVVRRLRDAAAVDAPVQVCGRGPKTWLTDELLLAGSDAAQLIRLVRSLPSAPETAAAFDAADINAAHACAITRGLATLPADLRDTVEPHLVQRARECPPEEIPAFVDELLETLGIDKPADVRRERAYASRGIDVAKTLDGHRSVAGTLTPDVGARVEQALALAGKCAGPEDERTLRQRQHDALGEIADAYLGSVAAATPNFAGAPRTVLVTMDLETLENELRQRWVSLPDGAKISAPTARRLACDATLIPAVLGGSSEPLDIGQADHVFTAAIRRAAWIRDSGRCAFPGCRNRPAELHHIRFRRHGGATSLDNAAWLCTFHHWLAHDGGWKLQRASHRGYLWTGPHGQRRERHRETAAPSAPLPDHPDQLTSSRRAGQALRKPGCSRSVSTASRSTHS